MLNLTEKGVAGLTIAMAAVAMAGASVGTPVAVDSFADQQPDSPFYGLEKAGEAIKEATFAGGENWHLERARERTQEFVQMAKENKAEKFEGLLERAGNRFSETIRSTNRVRGLHRAENALKKHINVLENVREKVPAVAKSAISLAISRSSRARATVASVAAGEKPGGEISENVRGAISNGLGEIEQKMEKMRERVRERVEKAKEKGQKIEDKANEIVENIEIETAEDLTNEVSEMVDENASSEAIAPWIEEAENRMAGAVKAAGDNKGLERAIEASQKHIAVLEGLENKVPSVAKPAILLAIERSSRHIQVLRNIQENAAKGIFAPGQIGQEIKEKVENIRGRMRERHENIKKQLQEAVDENEIEEIAEGIKNEVKETVKSWTGDENEEGKGQKPF